MGMRRVDRVWRTLWVSPSSSKDRSGFHRAGWLLTAGVAIVRRISGRRFELVSAGDVD